MVDDHTWKRSREPLAGRMMELPYCKAAPLQHVPCEFRLQMRLHESRLVKLDWNWEFLLVGMAAGLTVLGTASAAVEETMRDTITQDSVSVLFPTE